MIRSKTPENRLRDLRKVGQIFAKRFVGESPPPGLTLHDSSLKDHARRSDGFRFSLPDLQPGRYLVGISVNWRTILATTVVEVSDELVETTIHLPAPDPASHLEVRVYGPLGEKLRDVRFVCSYRWKGGMFSGGCVIYPRKDGAYFIRTPDPAEQNAAEGGTYSLKVMSEDYGSVQREFDPKSEEALVFRFEEAATLHVTLEGYVGSGHEGKLRLALGSDRIDRQVFAGAAGIDAEGRQQLGPVQPGDSVLVIGVEERSLFRTVVRMPIRLRPGDNRAFVPVPQLYTLKIVGRPGERVGITAVSAEREMPAPTIGKDGTAVVERLPAGKYEVWGLKDGERWGIPVVVPAQTEVRIE